MQNNYSQGMRNYNVDLVFCIDCTQSMSPVLNMVKNNAIKFYDDLMNSFNTVETKISQLRIRIVAFRDYIADGDGAMMVTDFFRLPEQNREFENCVRSLSPVGGGDEPEDGLEALAYSMKSDWCGGAKKRHIIVVWTDASTHSIGYGKKAANYPKNMAQSFTELTEWWGDQQSPGFMNQSAKRLLLFAPDAPEWNNISNCWDNVLHFPSKAGRGLDDYTYNEILNGIYNSI